MMSLDPANEENSAPRQHVRGLVVKGAASVCIALFWHHHDALLTFSAAMCLYALITTIQAVFRRDAIFARSFTYWDETLGLSFASLGALILRGAGA